MIIFLPAGSEVIQVQPKDWVEEPEMIKRLTDENMQKWAKNINSKWKDLLREFAHHNSSCTEGDCFSSLFVPHPFVVAGGRFREFYYWDSYWILEGLLFSGMYETAKGMLLNFFHIVETHGFIPNGGRIYYLNRSQPPFFDSDGQKIF